MNDVVKNRVCEGNEAKQIPIGKAIYDPKYVKKYVCAWLAARANFIKGSGGRVEAPWWGTNNIIVGFLMVSMDEEKAKEYFSLMGLDSREASNAVEDWKCCVEAKLLYNADNKATDEIQKVKDESMANDLKRPLPQDKRPLPQDKRRRRVVPHTAYVPPPPRSASNVDGKPSSSKW